MGCSNDPPHGVAAEAVTASPVREITLGGSPFRASYVPTSSPHIAFASNATGYMAAWYTTVPRGLARVAVARLTADTTVIDHPAIGVLPGEDDTASYFQVAGFGDRFLVATPTGSGSLLTTYAGTGDPTPIARDPAPSGLVASCDAAGCFVATGLPTPQAYRVDATGRVIAGAVTYRGPFDSITPYTPYSTAVGVARDQWLAVFEATNPISGQTDLFANRVLRDGTARDGTGVLFTTIGGARRQPAVASDGAAFLVAFRVTVGSGSRSPGIYAQRVDASGGVTAGPAVQLVAGADVSQPTAAWDGTRYWVAWQHDGALPQYARVAQDGALLDATPRTVADAPVPPMYAPTSPIVGATGGAAAILWQAQAFMVVQPLQGDGALRGAPHLVAYTADSWETPSLASDGTSFLASCAQTADVSSDKVARFYRVGVDGTVTEGGSYSGAAPRWSVWDGAQYRAGGEAGALTVTAAGSPSARTALTVPSGRQISGRAVVVSGVTLADLDDRSGSAPALWRLDAMGRPLDAFPIVVGGGCCRGLATDGTVAMVSWLDHSQRVSAAGDLLDVTPWDWSVTGSDGQPVQPYLNASLAYGGGTWALVGTDSTHGLWMFQKSSAATPTRATRLSTSARAVGVIWNGHEFVAVGATDTGAAATHGTLRAWGVSPTGVVANAAGVALDAEVSWSGTGLPAIAATRDGTVAVLYTHFDNAQNTYRCNLRLLSPSDTPTDAGADVVDAARDVPASDIVDVPARDIVDVPASDIVDVPRDTPPIDVPVIDAPVVDRPMVEEPVAVDRPMVEEPVAVDRPVVEETVVDVPIVDAPIADAPVVDDAPVDAGTRDGATDASDDVMRVDAAADVPAVLDAPRPDVTSVTDAPTATDAPSASDVVAPADASTTPPSSGCAARCGVVTASPSSSPTGLLLLAGALCARARRRPRASR